MDSAENKFGILYVYKTDYTQGHHILIIIYQNMRRPS